MWESSGTTFSKQIQTALRNYGWHYLNPHTEYDPVRLRLMHQITSFEINVALLIRNRMQSVLPSSYS
jgi:hypothetical protein